jgi:hypothetical protein
MPKRPRLVFEELQKRQEMLDRWSQLPLDRLPLAEMKTELKPYERSFKAVERAARAVRCDWQLPQPVSMKTYIDDSDNHPLREAIQWLRYRISVELAEGRFEDAERSLQTASQMAKHAGEGPTLIHSLVGAAFTAIALDAAARWGTAPGSPNLYWALATLPDPLIDLRPSLAGEAEVMANTFPFFREFEKGPVSEVRARELIEASRKELHALGSIAAMTTGKNPMNRDQGSGFDGFLKRLEEDFAISLRVPVARKWLRDLGVKDAEQMPPLQAVYLAAWLRYREGFADIVAACMLPAGDGVREARRVADLTKKALDEVRGNSVAHVLLATLPAYERILHSHIRIRRQLAVVRAIEALRAHLAVSGGKWPASWAEVKIVPVPDDPLTGKPFGYAVKKGAAVLTAPPPEGEPPTRSNNLRYELRVRSGK